MAYFGTIGGDRMPPHGPSCKACRQPILENEPSVRVEFQNFHEQTRGLSGLYHRQCGRPYLSLARVVNMKPWAGF
jgi:hypothetical protein